MRSSGIALRSREGSPRRGRCAVSRASGAAASPTPGLDVGGSLDALVTAAWAGLQADAPIACPLCDAAMEPLWSAGAGVVGGRCRDCGTELT